MQHLDHALGPCIRRGIVVLHMRLRLRHCPDGLRIRPHRAAGSPLELHTKLASGMVNPYPRYGRPV